MRFYQINGTKGKSILNISACPSNYKPRNKEDGVATIDVLVAYIEVEETKDEIKTNKKIGIVVMAKEKSYTMEIAAKEHCNVIQRGK